MIDFFHVPEIPYAQFDGENICLRLRSAKREQASAEAVIAGCQKPFPMEAFLQDEFYRYYLVTIPKTGSTLYYSFHIIMEQKEFWLTKHGLFNNCQKGGFFILPLSSQEIFKPPDWVKDAVFYEIFPDRFFIGGPGESKKRQGKRKWGEMPDAESFFGGNLEGISRKLDYLHDLGVTALYLTPVFKASSNHKYNTSDYLKVDPWFGTNSDLSKLVSRAHERKMRVILDGVFNHTGIDFFAFKDIRKNGKKSHYKEWYFIHHFPVKHDPPNYECWWNIPELPKLNTANREVQSYLFNAVRKWMKEAKIDGWRLDVPDEIPISFWKEFRKLVKNENPDAYIAGEIWNNASPWLKGDSFDGVMNYRFRQSILDFLLYQEISADKFLERLTIQLLDYPDEASRACLNLLESHDTPRFITLAEKNEKKVRLALVLLFTFVGVPMIYYGEEIGLEGSSDPDSRRCMIWDQSSWNKNIRKHVKILIRIRKKQRALRDGVFRPYFAKGRTVAFFREVKEEKILVCCNASPSRERFQLPEGFQWKNLLDSRIISGSQEITLEPYEGMIWIAY